MLFVFKLVDNDILLIVVLGLVHSQVSRSILTCELIIITLFSGTLRGYFCNCLSHFTVIYTRVACDCDTDKFAQK